jgi:hypothetical protein
MEGMGRDVEMPPRQLPGRTKENDENIPLVVVPAEIQTWHPQNDK